MGATLSVARILCAALLLAALTAANSIGQSVSIAKWSDNATGAYSVNHDDYGENWWGDFAFVDSILTNRNLTVSFSTIASKLDRGDSSRAAAFVRKGHRFINHSMNHICDTPLTAQATIAFEYDSAKAIIERKIPSQGPSLYFATPCGNQTATTLAYLRSHQYIGCRNDMTGLSPIDVGTQDPFNVGEPCNAASDDAAALNANAQRAITTGNFVSRMFHCVSDNATLGWAPIPLAAYRGHMDWCRQQMDSGRLWMAPVETVIKYALERTHWSVAVSTSDATRIQLAFDTSPVISATICNSLFDVPLTLLVTLPSGWVAADAQVVQGGSVLTSVVDNATTIRFNAGPWGGVVSVNRTALRVISQPLRPMLPSTITLPSDVAGSQSFLLDGRVIRANWSTLPGVSVRRLQVGETTLSR